MTSSSANSDPPQRPQIKNDDLEIIDIEDEVFYLNIRNADLTKIKN